MILVLSYEDYEQGTDPVISWLLHYQVPFVKVSLADLLNQRVRYVVDLPNRDVLIEGLSVKNLVTTIWHRRFVGAANRLVYPAGPHTDQLTFEVRTEIRDLVEYLELLFRDKTWLTPFHHLKVNKLELLDVASRCGLRVPHTRVLNNRRDLRDFYLQLDGQLISKPIADVRQSYQQEGCTSVVLTTAIDEERIAALPPRFFPSLFQEKVAIDFEIRAFYLDGEFFATAILNSAQRSVDKKLDGTAAHVHHVPYRLPRALTEALHTLMRTIGLNTGAIDLIRTVQGEYVFIEVNPGGQYLAESTFCNYALEKEIAHWLIKQEAA
jgi:hypothetical protein